MTVAKPLCCHGLLCINNSALITRERLDNQVVEIRITAFVCLLSCCFDGWGPWRNLQEVDSRG